MYININKDIIVNPLSKLVSITEKRSLMPILSNILLLFEKEKTTIYSTDLEISAKADIDLHTSYEKKIVVHGKKFLDIIKEMDNEEISIEVKENTMKIKQKNTEFVLSLQDPDEFPEIKEIKNEEDFIISGSVLIDSIEKVSFAVSTDETRYALTGLFMAGKDENLIMVGTDGYRMAQQREKIENLKEFKGIIIPKRSVVEIEKMIDANDEVRVFIDEKHLQISTKKMRIITRIIEDTFPDYENVMPLKNENIAKIEKDAFFKGLKKVSTIIGRNEPVKISIGINEMEIEAESDIGRAKEVVPIEYNGENITMNFNVRFLIDVASHIDNERIIIKIPGAYGAVLFEGTEGGLYRNVVMPIRV